MNESPPKTAISRLAPVFFAGALVAYLVVLALQGRLFHLDEVFYKCAGAHWAFGGLFAAPELVGRLPFDPPIDRVFACYPPLYPFLFGLFCRAFGFGYTQIVLFDGLLRVALCVTTAYVVTCLRPGTGWSWPSVIAGLLVLPLGWIGRPDDLGVIFGMLACTRLFPRSSHACHWQAGLLLGLSAATSPAAAATLAAVATGLVSGESTLSIRQRSMAILTMALVSASVLLAAFLPLLNIDAAAWRQILIHGEANLSGGKIWEAWVINFWFGRFFIAATAGAVLTPLLLLPAVRRAALQPLWSRWFLAPLFAFLLFAFLTAGKFSNVWFAGPWLIAASVAMLSQLWRGGTARWRLAVPALVLLGGCAYGAQFWLKERLAVASLPAEQHYDAAARRLLEVVPPGATVLTSEHWVTFLGRNPVIEVNFSVLNESWTKADYIVVTGNGSGTPGSPLWILPEIGAYAARNFVLIDDQLPRDPLRLAGFRMTKSAFGWGAAVYRRKTADEKRPSPPEVIPLTK